MFFDPSDLVIRGVIHELWLVYLVPDAHRACEVQLALCQVLRSLLHLSLAGIKTDSFYVVTLILLQAYDVQALGFPHDLDFLSQSTVASLL